MFIIFVITLTGNTFVLRACDISTLVAESNQTNVCFTEVSESEKFLSMIS